MPYVARRVALALALVWVVATIVFLAIHLVPGDPAELLLSTGGTAPDPATVAQLRDRLGLDLPLSTQYLAFLSGLLRGDLGTSLVDDYPVLDEIALRLPCTLELIGAGAGLAILVGVPAGTWAALNRGGTFDRAASATAAFVLAIPVFVVGTLLILLLAQTLRLMPAGGYVPFARSPGQHLLLLALPALAIAKGLAAILFRMTRSSVLDVVGQDHVRTARTKGLAPARVVLRHILRNALSPVLTVLGLHMGALLGGTVLVEYVFNWPGLSTSLGLHLFPELLRKDMIPAPLPLKRNAALDLPYTALGAASFKGAEIGMPTEYDDVYNKGVAKGDPNVSSAETGAALTEKLVTICAEFAQHFASKT